MPQPTSTTNTFATDDPQALLNEAQQAVRAGGDPYEIWSKIKTTHEQRKQAGGTGLVQVNPKFKEWMDDPDAEEIFLNGLTNKLEETQKQYEYQSWADKQKFENPLLRFGTDAVEGAVGSGARTVVNSGDLIRRGLGMDRIIDKPDVKQLTGIPDSAGGQLGRGLEGILEFAGPAGLTSAATKGASLIPRMLAQGGTAAAVGALQSGGDAQQAALSGIGGAAGPLVGQVAKTGKAGVEIVGGFLTGNKAMIVRGIEKLVGPKKVENIFAPKTNISVPKNKPAYKSESQAQPYQPRTAAYKKPVTEPKTVERKPNPFIQKAPPAKEAKSYATPNKPFKGTPRTTEPEKATTPFKFEANPKLKQRMAFPGVEKKQYMSPKADKAGKKIKETLAPKDTPDDIARWPRRNALTGRFESDA